MSDILNLLSIIVKIFAIISIIIFSVLIMLIFHFKGEIYILDRIVEWWSNKNWDSSLIITIITVETLIISLAFPLSIQLISRNSISKLEADIALMLFKEPSFIHVKGLIFVLMLLIVFLFFDGSSPLLHIISLGIAIFSLWVFHSYIKIVILYLTDFKSVLKNRAKQKLNELI